MKTLYLLRHAKAATPDGVDDRDRPLADSGVNACLRIGMHMQEKGLIPQKVLCSTSLRTRQTAEQVFKAAGISPPIQYGDNLYLATPGALLSAIQKASDDVSSLMIVAHNPGLHSLAVGLTGDGPDALTRELAGKFPPGALAVLECAIGAWKQFAPGGGFLSHFVAPKSLED